MDELTRPAVWRWDARRAIPVRHRNSSERSMRARLLLADEFGERRRDGPERSRAAPTAPMYEAERPSDSRRRRTAAFAIEPRGEPRQILTTLLAQGA